MLLYRYISKTELKLLLEGDKEKLGKQFFTGCYPNNHKYKKKHKYLHFFLNKEDAMHMAKLYRTRLVDYYIATFEMSMVKLKRFRGEGRYYIDDEEKELISCIEYAVPVKEFDPQSLIKYELDQSHHDWLEKEQCYYNK